LYARWFFQQIILGLDFCHRKDVAHRDIKLDNILVFDNDKFPEWPFVKLGDFGMTTEHPHTRVNTKDIGTKLYKAPELLQHDPTNSKQADVWSCGITLFGLLTGFFPFGRADGKDPSDQELLELIKGGFDRSVLGWRSWWCVDLLEKMLTVDRDKRITVQDIFLHPWFQPGLRPGAAEANAKLASLEMPNRKQFDDQIHAVVVEAVNWYNQLVAYERQRACAG
jgi:serine/threonine-protein kinase SRK2